ncbi:putative nif domain-containing protein [Phaeomoniella chlamydospora]|uniref:Mitochondrial import inner membrane translocase subunit TIM50 n=1 Tax=Phaeomoniella chlamydospora TaxID=158046 RepID=A0A0G2ETF0_PHACM|nr:putative nif domain-containing protein [Phaeomoniella chlamydospora]
MYPSAGPPHQERISSQSGINYSQSNECPPYEVAAIVNAGMPASKPQVDHPLPPQPTNVYLAQSLLPPVTRSVPQPLLIVLDLNGTLIARNRSTGAFKERPGLKPFLTYIFDYHVPMVYTSARPQNAKKICDKIFTYSQRSKLAAIWGRDKMGLTPAQYNEKVQVYKRLEVIWADRRIHASHPLKKSTWSQANTVLIDDSILKALAQPHNLLLVQEFERSQVDSETQDALRELVLKLEELKMQQDVSRLIRRWQAGTVEAPKAPLSQPRQTTSLRSWLGAGIATSSEEDVREALPQDIASVKDSSTSQDSSPAAFDVDDLSVDEDDDEIQKELTSQLAHLRTGKQSPMNGTQERDCETPGLDMLPKIPNTHAQGEQRQRSVSPIKANVFKELLGHQT